MPAASLLVPVAASVAGGIINKKSGGKFGDIVGPAAGLIGAGIGAYGQSKATSAQQKANDQALAFQREQEAARKANFDKAMAAYEQKWNAWNASRNALLQRYGINVQSATPSGMMGGGGAPADYAVPRAPGMTPQAPMGAPAAPPQAPPMAPGGQMNIALPDRARTVGALMRPELRYGARGM